MSSTLKKERIVYFTGIAVFVLYLLALCLPYIGVGLYTSKQSALQADYVQYLGWQFFSWIGYFKTEVGAGNNMPIVDTSGNPVGEYEKVLTNITPRGSESLFIMCNAALLFITVAIAVYCAFALYKSFKYKTCSKKKLLNTLYIGYVIVSFLVLVAYIPYVNYLNTHEFTSANNSTNASAAKAWSSFAFKSLTGVETKMCVGPFIIAAIGLVGTFISLICTMQLQDNSIFYPYKKRHVFSSLVCIVLCVSVFFLPYIDYYFSTFNLYTRGQTGLQDILIPKGSGGVRAISANGHETLADGFKRGIGWDCINSGSGDISGYYKVMFILMFIVAVMGIVYSIANLLGAAGVIRFNFDRKYIDLIACVIMIFGIMLWVGSFVYSYSVNVRLDTIFNDPGYVANFTKAYPDGQFPRTICTVGAWLSMIPGIVGFGAIKVLNAYDD